MTSSFKDHHSPGEDQIFYVIVVKGQHNPGKIWFHFHQIFIGLVKIYVADGPNCLVATLAMAFDGNSENSCLPICCEGA